MSTRLRRAPLFALSLSVHAGLAFVLLYVVSETQSLTRPPTASVTRFAMLPTTDQAPAFPEKPRLQVPEDAGEQPRPTAREVADVTPVKKADAHAAPTERIETDGQGDAVAPDPKPVRHTEHVPEPSAQSAAPQAQRKVDQATAIGLQPVPSDAVAQTWEGMLLARLNQRKRYPIPARAAGQQGTAHIRLVIDRGGRLLDVSLWRSAGHALLDREAVALARRASPFPSPPEKLPGAQIVRIVPIDFYMR